MQSSFGSIAVVYYDALYIQNDTVDYRNDFIMQFSVSDQNFDSIALTCYVNQVAAYTKSFRTPGDVHVSEELTLETKCIHQIADPLKKSNTHH